MVCPPRRRSGIRYLALRRGERGHAAREHGMGLGCHQSPSRVRSHSECALSHARARACTVEFTKTRKLAFHFPTLLDGRRRPHLTCVTCYLMPRFVAREFCGFSTANDAKMITTYSYSRKGNIRCVATLCHFSAQSVDSAQQSSTLQPWRQVVVIRHPSSRTQCVQLPAPL